MDLDIACLKRERQDLLTIQQYDTAIHVANKLPRMWDVRVTGEEDQAPSA
jgi:hypothetical protein